MQPASFTHYELGCEATIHIQWNQDPYFILLWSLSSFYWGCWRISKTGRRLHLTVRFCHYISCRPFTWMRPSVVWLGLANTPLLQSTNLPALTNTLYNILYSCPKDIVRRIREEECGIKMPTVEVKTDDKDQEPQDKPMTTLSAHAQAQMVVKNDKISLATKLQVFNVKGLSGITRVVNLFPRESCSCPSTSECYHILAAKMILGTPETSKPVRRSLTQLRKNTRSRKDKKSGRKKPWPNDVMPKSQGKSTYPKHVLYKQRFVYLMLLYRWRCPWKWWRSSWSFTRMSECNTQDIW